MTAKSVWLAEGAAERLTALVRHAAAHSPVQAARLRQAGIDPAAVRGPEALGALPVMRKEALAPLQAEGRPFGGLLGEPVEALARIFLSPGEIYDPQGARPDYWRFGAALAAAGFVRGDLVLNCASYHLSPLGFIFDEAARALGCVVIPGGVGQQDLQIRVLHQTRANGYMGLPSYLLALLEKAAAEGIPLFLTKAFVAAEPLPPSLRAKLAGYGVDVSQGYGTADLGCVAYECPERAGMHLDAGVMVEICDPDGHPVPVGEIGEVVVTLLDETYPLLRFGTGDLSAFLTAPCGCGRLSRRIRGWLGRTNDVVKVRGVFLYPRQIEEALARFAPQVGRWQAVVEQDETHRDRLTIRLEPGASGAPEPGAVAAAIKEATRLTAEVEVVPAGAVPEGARRLDDRRRWE